MRALFKKIHYASRKNYVSSWGRFQLSKWTILLAVLGGISVIAIACHNSHVTQWVKAAAPGLFTAEAAPEEAKCYDFFEDNDSRDSTEDVPKKAEQGNAAAQAALGTDYFWGRRDARGNVVGRDYTQAERWLRQAAEQGKTKAQSLLARLYAEGGTGVQQNWAEADFWVVLAMQREQLERENKGLPSCASQVLHKDVEGHLNSLEKAEVSQRVQSWKPVMAPPVTPVKTRPAPRPAAAAAPAAQSVGASEAEQGACAGFARGSHDRFICEDQQKKILRMKDSQAQRDKVYQHPIPKAGQPDDGKTADADKESKGTE
jgi:TPR repeat protein